MYVLLVTQGDYRGKTHLWLIDDPPRITLLPYNSISKVTLRIESVLWYVSTLQWKILHIRFSCWYYTKKGSSILCTQILVPEFYIYWMNCSSGQRVNVSNTKGLGVQTWHTTSSRPAVSILCSWDPVTFLKLLEFNTEEGHMKSPEKGSLNFSSVIGLSLLTRLEAFFHLENILHFVLLIKIVID